MEASEFLGTVLAMHAQARDRGLFFQTTEDDAYRGRSIEIDGRSLLSFGSCSYLGLELDPRLIEGACDAARRYGTQFSTSRGYLSAPIYRELEASLDAIFDAHTVLAPTTTLGHLAALDVLAHEKDAIVLDHQVHQSVQQAANLARTRGTKVVVVKHEELDRAVEIVGTLARTHRTVWFATDGVNSMYGDLAPFVLLKTLLDVAPNVRLYVDDAHGMSWLGKHGRGSFLATMPLSPRIVLATSLAKAFGCGGGVLVLSDPAERDRIRMGGGTLLFSGPIQPPMLGAALASAKVHLSDEITQMQRALADRAAYTNRALRENGVRQLVENASPLFFVRLGLPAIAMEVAKRLLADGIYVNVSMYPTVPMRRAGIRLSINATHSYEEIDRVVTSLAEHVPAVLAENGISEQELEELFSKAVSSRVTGGVAVLPTRHKREVSTDERESAASSQTRLKTLRDAGALRLVHKRSIHEIDRGQWDRLVGPLGNSRWHTLAMLEQLHDEAAGTERRREHLWSFDYVMVHDAQGRPVLATYFTTSLQKDDFIMREEVSRACEERRREDPYFLTSRVTMMGSGFSEGRHLYVDRQSEHWRAAVGALFEAVDRIYRREGADAIIFRDMADDDAEMDALMLERGYLKAPMLPTHVIDLTQGVSDDELLARTVRKRRPLMRKIFDDTRAFDTVFHGVDTGGPALTKPQLAHLFELYRNVAGRKLRINVFEMPEAVIPAMLASPAWEIATVRPKHAPDTIAAWYAAHKIKGHYAPFVCGLDYRFVSEERSVYRVLLRETVRRAAELGAETLHLGMDADTEKSRFGTRVLGNCVYLQAREHFNGVVMRDIVANLGAKSA